MSTRWIDKRCRIANLITGETQTTIEMLNTSPSNSLSSAHPAPRRSRVLVRACVAVLVFCVLSSGVYFASKSGSNAEVYSNDFNVYYHAANEIRAGRDPYQNSLGKWTPYLYPPLLAEIIIPLTMLSVPVAAYLWFLISAGSMIGAALMSGRMSALLASESQSAAADAEGLFSLRGAVAAAAVIGVLRFTLDTFNLGQVNTIVAALTIAHVYLYARDKKALSAMALVLAISFKLTPALLIVYHIARLRLKFAVVCAALVVGVTALSFLPFEARGLDAFRIFANRTLKNEQGYNLADPGNQSLRGAIARLTARDEGGGGDETRRPVETATLAVAIVLLAAAVFAARRARSELAGVAPFFCCMALLSPLSWKAHFVILVLPIAYLLALVFHSDTPAVARRVLLSAIGVSFALFNLTSPRIIGLAAAEWADAHSLITLGAVLILFVALYANRRKFGKPHRVC